jgi:hypothetical protein
LAEKQSLPLIQGLLRDQNEQLRELATEAHEVDREGLFSYLSGLVRSPFLEEYLVGGAV